MRSVSGAVSAFRDLKMRKLVDERKCPLIMLSIGGAHGQPELIRNAHRTHSMRGGSQPDCGDPIRDMTNETHLADALAQCQVESTSWDPTYAIFLERLQSLNIGATAPKVGDHFPHFALPNAMGARIAVSDLFADGPLVLSFNRGGWCPYCRLELAAWTSHLAELASMGGRFVAITGEIGGRAEDLRNALKLDAEILCDVDHGLALELGLAFYLGEELRQMYLDRGLNLSEVYGTESWFLPIPATFVLDTRGIVRFAYADPDFRARAEPSDVLAVVAAMAAARN